MYRISEVRSHSEDTRTPSTLPIHIWISYNSILNNAAAAYHSFFGAESRWTFPSQQTPSSTGRSSVKGTDFKAAVSDLIYSVLTGTCAISGELRGRPRWWCTEPTSPTHLHFSARRSGVSAIEQKTQNSGRYRAALNANLGASFDTVWGRGSGPCFLYRHRMACGDIVYCSLLCVCVCVCVFVCLFVAVTQSTKSTNFDGWYLVQGVSERDEIWQLAIRHHPDWWTLAQGVPLRRQNSDGCKNFNDFLVDQLEGRDEIW